MAKQAENRHRIVAALAVLRDGDDASDLVEYASDGDRQVIGPLIDSYGANDDRELSMRQAIGQMVASERFSSISEIHPAWILEHLSHEPPRVVGIILRSLPSGHVRYLLKNMPPMLRDQIPDMVESFAVAGPVLEVIRRRFERHFLPMRVSRSAPHFGFDELYYLKGEELRGLIHDIGLTELAMALAGLSGNGLRAVYNRLELKEARRLQVRIREMKGVSRDLARQTRYTVLEVEGRHVGPERMIFRIGLAALASAMDEDHNELVGLIQQKLGPTDAYQLKRFIDERRVRFCPHVAAERRDIILSLVVSLAERGEIDSLWARFRPADEPLDLVSEDASLSPADEETATAQQLA